ncbi:MFS transporter [Acinetobacter guillouiae]|uniref:MFS transporter n=1 Tax=Acinetobacter guillouiae TaxID=106649 RepID=UPI001AE2898E|nr:MFS transporter [Acinetobacter guillouiae]MBP2545850.1 putative MFS family arabinose efflux permease [Acinetobacter guillouiae]
MNKTDHQQRNKTREQQRSQLSPALVMLLACAAGLSVANVYYAQPLLDLIAQDFKLDYSWVGLVVSLTQVGSIIALIFIVPLGDLIPRKSLMLFQSIILCLALISLVFSDHIFTLLLSMLIVGMLGTAMTQGLIVYASVLAAADERGKIVGTVQAGVLIGILLSRVLSGSLADWFGWQGVYIFSVLCMSMISVFLWKYLAVIRIEKDPIQQSTYSQIIFSLFEQLFKNRVLQIRGVLAFIIFVNLNLFWNALVFPLSVQPFEYSHSLIGFLGIIGAIGAVMAIRVGGLADRGYAQHVTQYAFLLLIGAWGILTCLYFSIWVFILAIILFDVAIQSVHVINQSLIFQADIRLHGRLVGAYMLFYALGSAVGSLLATTLYGHWGWYAVCTAGILLSVVGYLFWLFTEKYLIQFQMKQHASSV